MKKFLILLAVIFLFSAKISEAGHLEEILERGTIKIGTTGDYKPMSYFNKETGEYEGIDAELSKIIAESLGVKIEYVPTTWPTLTASFVRNFQKLCAGKSFGNVGRLRRWNFRKNYFVQKKRREKI